jgi:hypothetical protein
MSKICSIKHLRVKWSFWAAVPGAFLIVLAGILA